MFYEAPTVGLLARALRAPEAETPTALENVEQRAESRLERMQRRRESRPAAPALDAGR